MVPSTSFASAERPRALPASPSDDLLRGLTKRFAASAADYDQRAVFPQDNFVALQQAGLLGLTVARELGGQSGSLRDALRVLSAVAEGEPSTALILFMTYGYFAQFVSRTESWPTHIYNRVAREVATDISLLGGLRVEPELGTPVRGGLPKTTAKRTADGYRLSGRKIYSTGSTGLRWFSVWARTDDDEPRVGNFLVRSDSPGIRIEPTWDHLGMRASVSHDVVFEDTPVAPDHAVDVRLPTDWIPKANDLTSAGAWNALAISTIYNAVAVSARHWLVGYLKQRVPSNLGAPLSSLPRVQEKVGEIDALLYANRVLLDDAVSKSEIGQPTTSVQNNLIKFLATSNAIRAVEIGLELTGNPGLSKANPLERHYRDVLCSRIHSPQNDTILVAAGKSAFA